MSSSNGSSSEVRVDDQHLTTMDDDGKISPPTNTELMTAAPEVEEVVDTINKFWKNLLDENAMEKKATTTKDSTTSEQVVDLVKVLRNKQKAGDRYLALYQNFYEDYICSGCSSRKGRTKVMGSESRKVCKYTSRKRFW